MTEHERHAAGRLNRPFVGISSFLRSPVSADLEKLEAAIAVLGVPWDEGSPFMPGSRFGPRGIREHSMRFAGSAPGYYDPQARRQFLEHEMSRGLLVDVGDVDVLPTNAEGTFRNVTAVVRAVLDRGALPVVLGGDHSITFPVVRAYQEPVHVVHFDAHLDYAPFVHDVQFSNSHPFRHVRKLSQVSSLAQIGIRSLRDGREMMEDALRDGNRVVTMDEFRKRGPAGIAEGVPRGARCYVSIDIDVLDLPLVPGCVSAEPNGMSFRELTETLKALAERADVVGFDLVEVNPQLDVGTGITSYVAAHVVLEFLGRICDQPHWAERRGASR